jgi:hypothetical protein
MSRKFKVFLIEHLIFLDIDKRYLHLNKIGCKKRTRGTETSKYP